MTAPIPDPTPNRIITRRGIFIGAAASVICAPAIVRATSLMPVHVLRWPVERSHFGFVQRLYFAALYNNLRTGRMTVYANGELVSEARARRTVARALAHGWRPPGAVYSQRV